MSWWQIVFMVIGMIEVGLFVGTLALSIVIAIVEAIVDWIRNR